MSQQEVADILGVSRSSVMFWESPICKNLSASVQSKLCKLFKCTAIDLYGMDNLKVQPTSNEERQRLIDYILATMENNDGDSKE